jgi:hypothetical protein
MHDGAYTTLEAAARHMLSPVDGAESYDAEQLRSEFRDVLRLEQTDEMIAAVSVDDSQGVSLSDDQVSDLLAFLESLTSPSIATLPMRDVPERVPSGLPLAD